MLFQAALREARDRLSSLLAPAVPREAPRQRPEDFVDSPNLAADLSAMLFVLVVCVTYATVAPLMMLAGLIFFVVRWQVLAVRYLYVHVPRFDSGGAFWYLLWNQAGYGQLPFLLPLLVLPLAFKMRAEYRFLEASRRLSLTAARQLDANDPRLSEHFVSDAYWHPALRFSEAQPAHADPWAGGGHMPLDAVEESWNMEATTPARGVTMEACYPADPGK
ncbi:unnamed protein product [Prorocentrum cordatum]|uniref:CSC1/OSCA1-like 7TM region domain-containing protein n=1 Tax=Prorocentrum cordatum TaxID=2364126 RepID=A0ABN9UWS1_9DINO|nr:unnamed protein product [Polarella glacialis]